MQRRDRNKVIQGRGQCPREEQKSKITELAASEMICPGTAMLSWAPALGLWREYQNLLLN